MKRRVYGQYCGFARALELVGERWALMLVRDLLVGPKRFSDLERGLPGIPSNILAARLKEMEASGLVQRRLLPRPKGVVYELTETGAALEPAVLALGRWGTKLLGHPRDSEIVTPDSMTMALRTIFQPQAAKGLTVSYELRMGEIVLHARVVRGKLKVHPGPLPGADLTIETGPAVRAVLAREVTPAAALANGTIKIRGDRSLLGRFVELFKI